MMGPKNTFEVNEYDKILARPSSTWPELTAIAMEPKALRGGCSAMVRGGGPR